jgi:signal transduction histidine kinase
MTRAKGDAAISIFAHAPRAFFRYRRLLPLGIAAAALLILNGTSWWVHRVSSLELRANFIRNLSSTAEILAHQFESAYREGLVSRAAASESAALPSGSSGEAILWESPFIPLEEWLDREGAGLPGQLVPTAQPSAAFQDIYLLDRKGAVIATLNGDLVPNSGAAFSRRWNIHPYLVEDASHVIIALEERRTVTTQEVLDRGAYYLTAYTPIRDLDGTPAGLVGLRAHLLFGDRLAEIRRGLLMADLVGSLLLVAFAVMFYRLALGFDRAEARLQDQERLAQLGQMVSVVAHEIRNPLGIIEQTFDLVRRRYAKDQADELLDYIPEEVDRLNRIVSRFLEFARPQRAMGGLDAGPCNLREEVQKVFDQLQPSALRVGILLSLETGEVPVIPRLHPDSARQILLNLVLNALDATPPGKAVRMVCRPHPRGVMLGVFDEGAGMDAGQVSQALSPFYTTKEKGSGLGLPLVDKLVREAGGSLEIHSSPGLGTQITILFQT